MKMNLILGRRVLANGLILATTIITCSSLQADEKETKQQPNPATAQSGERANGGANRDQTNPNSPTTSTPPVSGSVNRSAGDSSNPSGSVSTGSSSSNPSSLNNSSNPSGSSASNQANSTQSMFVQKALKGGQMEVRMGQLAQQKGQNQEIKNLGEALVRDHTEANQRLQQIAQSLNISASHDSTPHSPVNSANPSAANNPSSVNNVNTTASATLDRPHDAGKHQAHAQAMSKLESQSGAEFDKEFVRMAIKHHKKDIAAFEQAERQVNDAQLKSFIEGTLPKLRQHLQMAQTAARGVGVDPSTIINDDWEGAPASGAPAAGQIGTQPSDLNNPGLKPRSSTQNGASISTEAQVGDRRVTSEVNANTADVAADVDLKTDADTNGEIFQKGDGKVLGLPTSKTDGKYLGIPVPDGKKDSADANVDVEVNKK